MRKPRIDHVAEMDEPCRRVIDGKELRRLVFERERKREIEDAEMNARWDAPYETRRAEQAYPRPMGAMRDNDGKVVGEWGTFSPAEVEAATRKPPTHARRPVPWLWLALCVAYCSVTALGAWTVARWLWGQL